MNDEFRDFIEKNKELIASSFEKARNYSNIIMMGGYVGLFAIWNFTKADLLKWQSMIVGLLSITSVFIFVIFELCSLWVHSSQTFSLVNGLKKAEKLGTFPKEYGQREFKQAQIFARIWPFFFFPAVLTAVAAGLILMFAFVMQLLLEFRA